MAHQLKSISKAGIPEAIAKVELYRYLNEPEEAESICRDILALDPPDEPESICQDIPADGFGLFGISWPLIPGISSLAACSVSPSLTSLSAPPAIDIPRCSPSFRVFAIPTSSSTTPVYCMNAMPRPNSWSATLRTFSCRSLKRPCAALPRQKRFGRSATTTAFSVGIVASDCWKAGQTFISSADLLPLKPRICRPSTRRAAQADIIEACPDFLCRDHALEPPRQFFMLFANLSRQALAEFAEKLF